MPFSESLPVYVVFGELPFGDDNRVLVGDGP